jgi:hypothetical protein
LCLARWLANLQDADSIVDSLLKQCYEAGPLKCDLYRPSLVEVRELYFETLAHLKSNPLPVPAHGGFGPDIITYEDISSILVLSLYSPLGFPKIAGFIKQISEKNGTQLAEVKRQLIPSTCLSPGCSTHPWSKECFSTAVSTRHFLLPGLISEFNHYHSQKPAGLSNRQFFAATAKISEIGHAMTTFANGRHLCLKAPCSDPGGLRLTCHAPAGACVRYGTSTVLSLLTIPLIQSYS